MDLGSARGVIHSFIGEYGSTSEFKLTGVKYIVICVKYQIIWISIVIK